jgi:hypothetical protein
VKQGTDPSNVTLPIVARFFGAQEKPGLRPAPLGFAGQVGAGTVLLLWNKEAEKNYF